MRWFGRSRDDARAATFRVTSVVPAPSGTMMVVNGVPRRSMHVSGLLIAPGMAPRPYALDTRFPIDLTPAAGQQFSATIRGDEVRVDFGLPDAEALHARAALADAEATVLADLAGDGRMAQQAGQPNALGIAATDPAMADKLVAQLGSVLGTPVSMDVELDGVRRTVRSGGGGHLSSAEAAELLRTGVAASASVVRAVRVDLPAALLASAGPEASLWDLTLEVHRADGSSYPATTRTAYRTEARRAVLGSVGCVIPVRIAPDDDTRVAVDGTTYDATHPQAPPG